MAGRSVLLVAPRPPPLGGIAVWTEAVARSLRGRFALEVFDTAPRDAGERPSESRFRFDRAWRAVALAPRFARRLRAVRPGLVHVSSSYHWAFLRDGLFVALARAGGARVLLHLHGGDFDAWYRSRPGPVRAAIRWALRRADRVGVLTAGVASLVGSIVGDARVCRLPNFAPDLALQRPASDARPRRPEPVALYVGAVIEAKGVREMLAAARAVEGFRLVLVGPVDAAFAASTSAERSALGDRVALLGSLPHEAIADQYAAADLFLLPSHREGMPLALLEAMAHGLAVVATPVGAIPEIVTDGETGLLVPPGDPVALAAAIRRLLDDDGLRQRLGAAARAAVQREHSEAAALERLGALYDELLGVASTA